MQGGPAFLKITGDTSLQSLSIWSDISLISHWARLQLLREKKWRSSLAFMVIVMLVVQALGSRYLASSFGTPNSWSLAYAFQAASMASRNSFSASGFPSTVRGAT